MGCLSLEHIDQKWTPLKVAHRALGAVENEDRNSLVLKDHLGSVRVEFMDDGTGTAVPTNVTNYYPFGLPWDSDTDTRNNWTYTGQELQRSFDLGLQRFDFRFYDPTIARFIEVDPISSDFAHVSTYNYAENEPVAHIDLWGLQAYRPGPTGNEHAELAQEFPIIRDLIIGATPAGIVQDGVDFKNAASEGNGGGMILSGLGFLPVFGDAIKGIGRAFKNLFKSGDEIASSLDDVVSGLKNGSDKFTDVDVVRDDDFLQVTGSFDDVDVGVQGTFSISDGVLTIDKADFHGEVGLRNIRPLIKEFGANAGVNKVTIKPNPRNTGANPGKTPDPFTIDVND